MESSTVRIFNKSSSYLHHLLSCTICTERYNEMGRRPKLLHCGHTFCMDCLRQLFSRSLQVKANKNLCILRCPTCRQTTETYDVHSVSQLADNFAIIGICLETNSEEPNTTYCKKHRDEQFKFFCDQCQRLLCPSCALRHVSQKLHNVENAESAALKYRRHIQLAINGCKKKQNCLDEIIQVATAEKLKFENLSKSFENMALDTSDTEFLLQKQIIKKLREYSSVSVKSQNLLQRIKHSFEKHSSEQSCLNPPGFWSGPHPREKNPLVYCNQDDADMEDGI